MSFILCKYSLRGNYNYVKYYDDAQLTSTFTCVESIKHLKKVHAKFPENSTCESTKFGRFD